MPIYLIYKFDYFFDVYLYELLRALNVCEYMNVSVY